MNKRTFLKTTVLSGAGILLGADILHAAGKNLTLPAAGAGTEGFVQPALGYAYNALEPWIDAQTMEIHYSKHHAAYTKNLNAALTELNISEVRIESLLAEISKYPLSVRNNGGGFYNHNLYWKVMTPGGSQAPQADLLEKINKSFVSFDAFKEEFSKKAMSVFGSGWTWLIEAEGKLKIVNTANQDNPLMDVAAEKGNPLLCIDIWEHAYYLKYQNRRKEYVDNFWKVINWDMVNALLSLPA
ncbi:MAG: superoxide dismutase [Bacteroidales bacterium]